MQVKAKSKLQIKDFYEDCGYHPCICISIENDNVTGISLIDGGVRSCGLHSCGIRILTFEQALQWKKYGPRASGTDEQSNIDLIKHKWWK